MAVEFGKITLRFLGNLLIDSDNKPTYVGGKTKMIKVQVGSTYDQLRAKVYNATKINPQEYGIHLTANVPHSHGHKAIPIEDDDDVDLILEVAKKDFFLEVYVERDTLPSEQNHNDAVGEFTRMLNMDVGTTGFVSPTTQTEGYENVFGEGTSIGIQTVPTVSQVPNTQFDFGTYNYQGHQPEDCTQFDFSFDYGQTYQNPSNSEWNVGTSTEAHRAQITEPHVDYSFDYGQTQRNSRNTEWNAGTSTEPDRAQITRPSVDHHPQDNTQFGYSFHYDHVHRNPSNTEWNAGTSTEPHRAHDVSSRDHDDHDDEVDRWIYENNILQNVFGDEDEDEDDDEWINQSYANNDYVEFEEPPADDMDDDDIIAHSNVPYNPLDTTRFAIGGEDDGVKVGDVFETKSSLLQVLSAWSIKRGVQFKPIKTNGTTYTAVCAINPGTDVGQCRWRIHASVRAKDANTRNFTVKKYESEHTCVNAILQSDHRQAKAKFISKFILPMLKRKLDLSPAHIQDYVESAFHIRISYSKAWNARTKAVTEIFGDWEKSYEDLPLFLESIKRRNPDTVYKLCTTDTGLKGAVRFDSLFWAFGQSMLGFQYCRPVISIDGTHLYGKYPGCLLVATGVDAEGGLYPLAFAVVDSETTRNWEWFLTCIYIYIPAASNRHITFLSDRMKGLPAAIAQSWPRPHAHRYCIRHIRANFSKDFTDETLRNELYEAASTPTPLIYEMKRLKIKSMCPRADAWIKRSLDKEGEADRWALSKDGGYRFGIMTTNCSESFNGVLKGARALPIQALVARTFWRLNKYFVKRREMAETWNSTLAPKIEMLLSKRLDLARKCGIRRTAQNEWKVTDKWNNDYWVVMNGDKVICDCQVPQLEHLPCVHVIAACSKGSGGANMSYYQWSSEWYNVENYRSSYAPVFHPYPDRRHWLDPEGPRIFPPFTKRQPGRPPSTRIHGAMDECQQTTRRRNKCSKCGTYGHNKARCTGPPVGTRQQPPT